MGWVVLMVVVLVIVVIGYGAYQRPKDVEDLPDGPIAGPGDDPHREEGGADPVSRQVSESDRASGPKDEDPISDEPGQA